MHLIILGSGFSSLKQYFKILSQASFHELLDIDYETLEGHERIIYEIEFAGCNAVIISGKFHIYEGFTSEEVCAPISYALDKYDIRTVIVTAASGGLAENIYPGKWYNVESIQCAPSSKMVFPHFSQPKTKKQSLSMVPNHANYTFQTGPSLGTPSEYKMLHEMGADLVGMSMYPEQIFLNGQAVDSHFLSLPVCNYFPFENMTEPTHQEVLELAREATSELADILKALILQEQNLSK